MKSRIEFVLKMMNCAALGAACGVVLASIGNVLSSSTMTLVFTIVACALPGSYQRNLVGIILDAISGALLAAFGNLIGGTTFGVVMTMIACSLLGVMIGWADYRDTASQPAITPHPSAKVGIASATERSTEGNQANYGITSFSSSWHWIQAWLLESYDCGEWVLATKPSHPLEINIMTQDNHSKPVACCLQMEKDIINMKPTNSQMLSI